MNDVKGKIMSSVISFECLRLCSMCPNCCDCSCKEEQSRLREEYETDERLYQREKNPDGDLG